MRGKNPVLSIFLAFAFLILAYKQVSAAATEVTSLSPGPTSVGRYKKFEVTFTISRTFPVLPDFAYPDKYDQAREAMLPYYYYDPADTPQAYPNRSSPYGVDGITIDAVFTTPQTRRQVIVPAFYYQNFSRNGDTMVAQNEFSWKVRFAPDEAGRYTYFIRIVDKFGSWNSQTYNFETVDSSSKGFVRVSASDSRYFEFDNRSSFVPIGHGGQWYPDAQASRVTGFETAFNAWGQNGINFTRLWDQNDGYSLTTEGHFDAYQDANTNPWYYNRNPQDNYNNGHGAQYNPANLAKGTQINQRGAFEKDLIFQSAEKNGVYIQLCSHEDPYWIWDADIHGSGRTLNDLLHMNYWKRNYRYRIARWGYSTSLLGWEAWNEHYPSGSADSNYYDFYAKWVAFVKQTDPYKHLVTTSLGSQSNYTDLWSSSMIGLDYANYHDYLRDQYPTLKDDEALFVYRFAWCLVNNVGCSGLVPGGGVNKPWVWGEIDVLANGSDWQNPDSQVREGEGRVRLTHNTTWAGLFSPMGTSPLDWWWYLQANPQTNTARLADRRATAKFFETVDFSHAGFVHLMSEADAPPGYSGETVTTSDNRARVYAMRRGDKKAAYVWIQNKSYTWVNAGSVPGSIRTTITMRGLLNQSYTIVHFDTHSGNVVKTETGTPAGGTISVAVDFNSDMALKIEATSGVPSPSVGASPTVVPTPANTVNIKRVLGNWLTGVGDRNGDGKVNSLDLALLL